MTTTCDASAVTTQGPEWLAQLYLCPPWWLNPALAVIGLVALLLVLHRLRERGWTIGLEEQRRMLTIAWTVVGVLVATLAMVRWSGQGYLVDVGVGVLIGWGGVTAVSVGTEGVAWPSGLDEPRVRLLAAWGVLAVVSILAGRLSEAGQVPLLGWSRYYLAVLGVAMMLYNGRQLDEEGT